MHKGIPSRHTTPPFPLLLSACEHPTMTDCCRHARNSAGTVMVTFKSRYSLPPYRIENACSDVVCWFAQVRRRSLADLTLRRHLTCPDRCSSAVYGLARMMGPHESQCTTRAAIHRTTSDMSLACVCSQGALKGSNQAWNVLTPRPGGNNLAYAWDEPTLEHKLLVHVRVG